MLGFLFNKVAANTDVFLRILRYFQERFFTEHLWWLLLFISKSTLEASLSLWWHIFNTWISKFNSSSFWGISASITAMKAPKPSSSGQNLYFQKAYFNFFMTFLYTLPNRFNVFWNYCESDLYFQTTSYSCYYVLINLRLWKYFVHLMHTLRF